MLVFDTSAVIGMVERTNQTPSLRDLLHAATSDADIVTTEITLGELRHGVAAAANPHIAARRQRTYNAISELEVLSIDNRDGVIDRYATFRTLRPRCSHNDTWILAICASAGATLLTEDESLHRLSAAANVESILLTSDP